MKQFINDTQFSRLLDAGLAACHLGAVEEARIIHAGLLAERPDSIPARIGMAFCALVVDDFATAEQILKSEILEKHPDDADALVMLALVYRLSGRQDEAIPVLERLEGTGAATEDLAKTLLAEMRSA